MLVGVIWPLVNLMLCGVVALQNECVVVIKLNNEMACFDKDGSITHSNNVAYFNNNYEILRKLGTGESLVIEGGN